MDVDIKRGLVLMFGFTNGNMKGMGFAFKM